LLKRIERAIVELLGYSRPESTRVSEVTGISPRERVAIRAALVEAGIPAARRSQPLLYRELNRNGQRVWRAA
jgi:hypothetical protein